MSTGDWIALLAVGVALFGILRANRTTSAATMVALNEGYRQGWVRFLTPDLSDDDRAWELAELMNLLEIGCAAYLEKSITGCSREILFDYLDRVLKSLISSDYANSHIEKGLIQSDETYIFVRMFLNTHPKLSVTIPPKWYQLAASAKRKRRWTSMRGFIP